MKAQNLARRLTALLPALSLLLSLAACGQEEAKATTMHLKRAEGTVAVSDDTGEDVPLLEDLGLYSGYGVDTRSASFAWIDLDSVKLTKMDEDSEIAIRKEDKLLEIEVKSGSLFFNVTEPLAEDESMTIRTSTMMVGIRGTCGWVAQDAAALLEGTVEVTAGEQSVTLSAGERAVLTVEGRLEVKPLTAATVPAFVREEVEEDETLAAAIVDDPGAGPEGGVPEIPGNPPAEYRDALLELRKRGEILYTEMVDFEADGNPELLVLHTREDVDDELFAYSVFRAGPDGVDDLMFYRMPVHGGMLAASGFSLVESGGRMYLESCKQFEGYTDYVYEGSIAEKDGVHSSWSGDQADWTMLYWIRENTNNRFRVFTDFDGEGSFNGGEEKRYQEIRGKFSIVKVLAYSPDGKTLIITPDSAEVAEFPQPAVTP